MSWIENHSTSIGVPDINYSYYGVEGWVELKCGPEIEIRAAQKIWMEERIEAGGFPLFLIQYGDTYIIAPGSAAASLRAEPHEENVRRHATALWEGKINPEQFLKVLKNPRKYYNATY